MRDHITEITFYHKTFDALSLNELYDILVLRQMIFIVEQSCPYLDADGRDQAAIHLLGHDSRGTLHAYARIVDRGVSYPDYPSIGRIIVSTQYRGTGLGKSLMQQGITICQSTYPGSIKISAQVYALPFYEKLGFQAVGDTYLEDDIEHVGMVF